MNITIYTTNDKMKKIRKKTAVILIAVSFFTLIFGTGASINSAHAQYYEDSGGYYGDPYYTDSGSYYEPTQPVYTDSGGYYGDPYYTDSGSYYEPTQPVYTDSGGYYGYNDPYYTDNGGYYEPTEPYSYTYVNGYIPPSTPVYSQSYTYITPPAPTYTAPTYTAPTYTAPTYTAPTYTAPTYTAPTYTAPTYTAPTYTAPTYNAPTYNAPTYNAPTYNAPTYTAYVPPVVTQPNPVVTISSNPSVINYGSNSILTWSSADASNCYASGGWSGTKSLTGSETVTPSVNTTYYMTCTNNTGQAQSQTVVYVNNQQTLAPSVNISANPSTINRGASSILVWSSSNASQCYASGGWSGARALSGSETVTPDANTTYSIICSNSVGSAVDTDTVFVNNVLSQSVVVPAKFAVACVTNNSVGQVGKAVSFVAGHANGIVPVSYTWSGDVVGTGETISFTFGTTGTKTAHLKAFDAAGKSAEANCSIQINPVTVTVAPKPEILGAATNNNCPPVVTAAAVCETKTVKTCSDGSTYINGVLQESTGTNLQGVDVSRSNQETSADTNIASAGNSSEGRDKSLLASLFVNEGGNPSRLLFLFIWYFILLSLVGFAALVYTVIKRRERV